MAVIYLQSTDLHAYVHVLQCCRIAPGQRCRSLTGMQQKEMIRYTAKPPAERKRNIEKRVSSKVSTGLCQYSFSSFCQVNSANFNCDPYLRDYGLSVCNEMETVRGRVLPAPSILYQEEGIVSAT